MLLLRWLLLVCAAEKDYYAILGIEKTADASEVKKASAKRSRRGLPGTWPQSRAWSLRRVPGVACIPLHSKKRCCNRHKLN